MVAPISRTNATISIDPEFIAMFPHLVTIIPTASLNAFGEPQPGTPRIVYAFVDPPLKAVNRPGDREEQDRATLVIVADIEVVPEDKIILPDGTTRIINSVQRHDYVTGLDHSMIQCS